jgi:hypothetical protein
MPRKDFTQIAFDVVQQATGAVVKPEESAKTKAGRKGGLKGGAARATALTPEQRKTIAKKAAAERWKTKKIASSASNLFSLFGLLGV